MYKITADGKTMVGCNEDAWRTTSRIWFENKKQENEFGAGFTGSRKVANNKFAPQSGMNEAGLVFSRLVAFHPKKNINLEDKKQIKNEVEYLSDILHKCRTVGDVKSYIEQYDHSIFIDDVFIYIDNSGDYLVVEPYDLIEGSDPTYVLANFCPSITSIESARKQERFKNGNDFLDAHIPEASLAFCTAMSDTMHVCRKRNGDGTLLTSIWDTQKGLVNLYFYHSYDSTVQFNLSEELAKGDHIIDVSGLFPENPEFARLANYKTPFNLSSLRFGLVFIAGFLLLLALLHLIGYFKKRIESNFKLIQLVFVGLNALLIGYLIILATNINIYYFDAPYQHYSSNIISLSSYIPVLLLTLIIPIIYFSIRFIRLNSKSRWTNRFLVFNNFIYLTLLISFGYWGLLTFIHS